MGNENAENLEPTKESVIPKSLRNAMLGFGGFFGLLVGLSNSPTVSDALPALIAVFAALVGSAGIFIYTQDAMKRAGTIGLAFVLAAAIGLTAGIVIRFNVGTCAISGSCPAKYTALTTRQQLIMRENLYLINIFDAAYLLPTEGKILEFDPEEMAGHLSRTRAALERIKAAVEGFGTDDDDAFGPIDSRTRKTAVKQLDMAITVVTAMTTLVDHPEGIAELLLIETFTSHETAINSALSMASGLSASPANLQRLGEIASSSQFVNRELNTIWNVLLTDPDVLNMFLRGRLKIYGELGDIAFGDVAAAAQVSSARSILESLQ